LAYLQVFSLLSRLGINHLKLRYYSGTTPLKLRCWQICWQSKTQKILSLPEILPLIGAVTNALSCSISRPLFGQKQTASFQKERSANENVSRDCSIIIIAKPLNQ
jgi:hypothetical protein